MTEFERLQVEGCRADLEGRLWDRLKVESELVAMVPELPVCTFLLGNSEKMVNQPRAAIKTLESIRVTTFPERGVGFMPSQALAEAYHLAGDFQDELRIGRQKLVYFPDVLTFYSHQAMALAALGRPDEVDRVIDACLVVPARRGSQSGTPAGVMEDAAFELRAHGHPERAHGVVKREIDWINSRAPAESKRWRFELGRALYLAERWQEARVIFIELARGAPQNIEFQGYIGALAARLDNRAESERVSEALRALDGPYRYGLHTYCRARIASLLGEREKAVGLLRDAFSQGYRFTISIHRDPDFEPLRGYAPYEELMRPKG